MRKLPKILAVMFLSTFCLLGTVACEKTAAIPPQQRVSEAEDSAPEEPFPESPDGERPEPDDKDPGPHCPDRRRHGKRRGKRCPHEEDVPDLDGQEQEGEENGERDGEEDSHPLPPAQKLLPPQKRLPVTPVPRPLPNPKPTNI